jgi:colicin import membrane protein
MAASGERRAAEHAVAAGVQPAERRRRRLSVPIILSLLLHAGLFAALIFSVDFRAKPIAMPEQPIVEATVIDTTAIEAEQKRQREAEAEQQRQLREAERKRAEQEQKRIEAQAQQERVEQQRVEQQRQAEVKKQAEEKRLAEEKKQVEEKRQAEAKKQAEEKRLVEEKKQAEEKRLAEEKKKADAARKAAEARRAEEQEKADQREIAEHAARIRAKVEALFSLSGQPPGLRCTIYIKLMPGGDVVETRIVESSGNAVFDRQALIAVAKAVPLPVPAEPRVFRKMQEINIEFQPN